MRELLKEAAEVLRRGQADEQAILAKHIGDVLAEPELDAMEMAYQIKMLWVDDHNGERHNIFCPDCWKKYQTEAAALVESYSRRVPRAMLDEIADQAFAYGKESFLSYETIDAIAAKYGVEVEG